MSKFIELVIPVLNEEKTIKTKIKELMHYLQLHNLNDKFQVTIVDNGSKDKTADLALELEEIFPIKFIRLDEIGVGRALKKAWQDSESEYVGYIDLDLSTHLIHLAQVVEILLESKPIVLNGSRYLERSQIKNRKLSRTISSKVFNWIVRNLFGTSFSDAMCGFKFIQKSHFDKLSKKYELFNTWFFCTEILILSEIEKIKVVELPIKWHDDRDSKVKILKLSKVYMGNMIELKKKITNVK